jgi:hypothetical protein
MLLVQKFLETNTFKQLQETHGVYASFSNKGYKWSLNYDQIEAKENDPLAQECRGLILSTINGEPLGDNKNDICPGKTNILAYPMNRFFNYGQGAAANIDWTESGLSVLEKLDGTLIILYYDKFANNWFVATRSVSEADIVMSNGMYTFRTLFEKAIKDMYNSSFDDFTKNLNKDITYCFELTSPFNCIVVNYLDTRITLLAARNILTNSEIDLNDLIFDREIVKVQSYDLNCYTADDILSWVSEKNPLEHEGVVVRDSKFNRIKIKNLSYVLLSKTKSKLGSSQRNMLELILSGKDDDVIVTLPLEMQNHIIDMKNKVNKLIVTYDNLYYSIKRLSDLVNKGDKKTFVSYLMQNTDAKLWSAPLFNIYDNKSVDMKDFLRKSSKNGSWSNSILDKILDLINS